MSFSSGNSSLPLLTQQMPLGLAIRFVPLRTTHMHLPAAHAGPQLHPLRPPWCLHVRFCMNKRQAVPMSMLLQPHPCKHLSKKPAESAVWPRHHLLLKWPRHARL